MTYQEFLRKVRLLTGLDLESYKERQMERRIRQLLQREKLDFGSFYARLAGSTAAKEDFLEYLTINTSAFFRDEHIYAYLADKAIGELLREHGRIKIWSAGCATGEEPYTLSIILHELGAGHRAEILAGDIDPGVLEKAERGCYQPRQVQKVAPGLKRKYFDRREDCYYFRDRYKQMITFRRQNLLKELNVPAGPVQLILCRNVFIYFKAGVQEKLIEHFSALLPEGGYLVTGCTEMITRPQYFDLERKIPAIYRKVRRREPGRETDRAAGKEGRVQVVQDQFI